MNKKTTCMINGLKYPRYDKISGRISTICRSMACTLLERKGCSYESEQEWMKFFPNKKCAYCGKDAMYLDHLHPLIIDRKPTGYCTEPANLVPCCSTCNQLKGNVEWEEYMRSSKCVHAGNNPKIEMEKRIKTLSEFEKTLKPNKAKIDNEILKRWEKMLNKIEKELKNTQKELDNLKRKIYDTNN